MGKVFHFSREAVRDFYEKLFPFSGFDKYSKSKIVSNYQLLTAIDSIWQEDCTQVHIGISIFPSILYSRKGTPMKKVDITSGGKKDNRKEE